MFSSRFMLFPTLKKKKIGVKKIRGGGGIEKNKILRIFFKYILKSAPSLTG